MPRGKNIIFGAIRATMTGAGPETPNAPQRVNSTSGVRHLHRGVIDWRASGPRKISSLYFTAGFFIGSRGGVGINYFYWYR
jgi:hypothetical protein